MRGYLLAAILPLTACGGGGAASDAPFAPMVRTSAAYVGVLRYQPSSLVESLSAPSMQYVYVDSQSSNGYYPDDATFMSAFAHANPDLVRGPCSAVAILSEAVVDQTLSGGVAAPTIVISAYPLAVGTCEQKVDLGLRGEASFEIAVSQ